MSSHHYDDHEHHNIEHMSYMYIHMYIYIYVYIYISLLVGGLEHHFYFCIS